MFNLSQLQAPSFSILFGISFNILCMIMVSPSVRADNSNPHNSKKIIYSKISEIIDYQTIGLQNGQVIRLTNLHFFSPSSKKGTKTYHQKITSFLKNEVLGKTISYPKTSRANRRGHILTTLKITKNGFSTLQALLIEQGYALFFARHNVPYDLKTLQQAEQKAQTSKAGLWSKKKSIFLKAKPAKTLNWKTQQFHIIAGKIEHIGQSRKMVYLNFDKNWRKDFTIMIHKKSLSYFEKNGFDLNALKGKIVQVRGWLEFKNGPAITLKHLDNLRVID